MTIPRWGRITPAQGDMLMLAGFLLRRSAVETPETDEDRLAAMRLGREMLRRLMGQDHGYDLRKWHEALLADAEVARGYKHPYAWRVVRRAIESAFADPNRERLVGLLDSEP